MKKNTTQKIAENSSPHRGGGIDVGLEKNLSFFADYKGEN